MASIVQSGVSSRYIDLQFVETGKMNAGESVEIIVPINEAWQVLQTSMERFNASGGTGSLTLSRNDMNLSMSSGFNLVHNALQTFDVNSAPYLMPNTKMVVGCSSSSSSPVGFVYMMGVVPV